MSKDELDSIIAKIQKLLNLQEGAEAVGSYAEAENAASKVQLLLMKYNLDLENVKGANIRKRAEFFDGWVSLADKADKRESFWVPKLFKAIGDNNLCRVTAYTDGIFILGRKEQVELVLYIAEQMISKIRIAEKFAWNEYTGEEKRGTFRRGFFSGASEGINMRLRKEKNDDENPYAIMVVSREKELDTFLMYGTIDPDEIELIKQKREQQRKDAMEEYEKQLAKEREMLAKMTPKEIKQWEKSNKPKYRKTRKRKGPRGLSSNDGYIQGHRAGQTMSINKGVNEQK